MSDAVRTYFSFLKFFCCFVHLFASITRSVAKADCRLVWTCIYHVRLPVVVLKDTVDAPPIVGLRLTSPSVHTHTSRCNRRRHFILTASHPSARVTQLASTTR